jgi:uncharacterized membrane protein YkvI
MGAASSWFQRWLLPGFAFKAVVIGGGYATGRELAEFFLPIGPWGGLLAIGLAMLIWSAVCVATFLFAQATASLEYRSFFRNLLGPLWGVFEATYLVLLVLVLAVIGAAAGEIGAAMLGWPTLAGAAALTVSIAGVTAYGNAGVERLFKYASMFLYLVYFAFLFFCLTRFGERIAAGFDVPFRTDGWAVAGVTYASYNLVAAVAILSVVRHMTDRRDAVVAGLAAGPLAMIPAILFFVCMIGWTPQIASEPLPSDFMLRRLDLPAFHILYQLMIFVALLETGTGCVHAVNERIARSGAERRRGFPRAARLSITAVLLVGSMFVAERVGLVALIANGYRAIAWVFLAVYVLPLMTWGVWQLWTGRASRVATA